MALPWACAKKVSRLLQPAVKAVKLIGPQLLFATVKDPDHRHRWLLSARSQRKDNGRTTNKAEELAPPHSALLDAVFD